jgi:hypothetical protein
MLALSVKPDWELGSIEDRTKVAGSGSCAAPKAAQSRARRSIAEMWRGSGIQKYMSNEG